MKTRFIPAACALFLITVLAGCGSDGGSAADSPAGNGTASASAGAAKGNLAPDFELALVDGGRLKLSDLRGQAVILDFWDTWCPPCRRALPHLQELHDQYSGRLTVVGVALGRDGRDAVAKFMTDRNLTFPCVLMDEKYDTARNYGGIQSIPTTFLIDGEGVIREIWLGGYEKAAYETALTGVLDS